MRLLAFLLLSACSFAALAEQPAKLEPLPPPPDMLAVSGTPVVSAVPSTTRQDASAVDEPAITITKQAEQTVEEYRMGGRLYMIKVTPKGGTPYYLVDDRGDGKFARQESLDSGFRPPQWIIHRF
jgi:hypothetical protein